MAYRNAVVDPHLPPYSRGVGTIPFWTETYIGILDLTDTDITTLFVFPEEAWILNRAGAVELAVIADLDTGATDLDLNFNVVVAATGVQVHRLATTTQGDSTENFIPMVSLGVAEGGFIDVGGMALAVEVETAAGTAAGGLVQCYGHYSVSLKQTVNVVGLDA
jgi:hypothetical protein